MSNTIRGAGLQMLRQAITDMFSLNYHLRDLGVCIRSAVSGRSWDCTRSHVGRLGTYMVRAKLPFCMYTGIHMHNLYTCTEYTSRPTSTYTSGTTCTSISTAASSYTCAYAYACTYIQTARARWPHQTEAYTGHTHIIEPPLICGIWDQNISHLQEAPTIPKAGWG